MQIIGKKESIQMHKKSPRSKMDFIFKKEIISNGQPITTTNLKKDYESQKLIMPEKSILAQLGSIDQWHPRDLDNCGSKELSQNKESTKHISSMINIDKVSPIKINLTIEDSSEEQFK